tara:strand:+ start:432 stop:707 length:276 start_codon:yes stop_codon:yes gene_type:complete
MIFTPEQLPQSVEMCKGKKTILFSNGDILINLFCRVTNKGNLKVIFAERIGFNEETEQWDMSEEIEPQKAIKEFEHKKVLNPLTGKAGDLI